MVTDCSLGGGYSLSWPQRRRALASHKASSAREHFCASCASLPVGGSEEGGVGLGWQGVCVHEDGTGSLGSISVPPRFGFSRSISFLVGNILNSEHYFLKLIFKLWTVHVTTL